MAENLADQTTPILSDKATRIDGLDFTPYVNALVKIIRSDETDTPLTIGVFGDWGSGKTSLMLMARDGVEGFPSVWFDAWKYDKEEALWRALLLRVLNTVEMVVRDAAPPETAGKKQKEEHARSLQSVDDMKVSLYRTVQREEPGKIELNWEKLISGSLEAAVQISLAAIPGLNLLQAVRESIGGEAGKATPGKLLSALERASTQVYINHIESLEQFQERFQFVVETYIRPRGKLVVFIDDLDRCLPEKALEVLEAMKLFLDVPGCVFVLGLDDRVIARGIELKYRELRKKLGADGHEAPMIDGADYLEKIVQLPFRIPPIERGEMNKFIGGLVSSWPDAECPKVFAAGLGKNPRQVKRTVNVFLLLWNLVQERAEKLGDVVKPIRLAKVVTLQSAHRDLYDVLQDTPRLLRDLEAYYWEDMKTREETLEKTERAEAGRVELPPRLAPFAGREPLRRLLTLHPREQADATFADLSLDDLDIYFYLTKTAEAPQPEPARAPAARPGFLLPEMIRIPAGPFTMGSTEADVRDAVKVGVNEDWVKNELRQHTVILPEYSIGRFPVTNREYQAFVAATKRTAPRGWDRESYPEGKEEHPVVNVTWHDALEYCRWLEQNTGEPYTLPSEAEWEKAARGSEDARRYPWGDMFEKGRCNTSESGIGDTTPVGQFSPQGDSLFGCVDMSGNVWEWTRSHLKAYQYDPEDGREDLTAGSQVARVLRGGSFYVDRDVARVSFRYWNFPDLRNWNFGFRVALPSRPQGA